MCVPAYEMCGWQNSFPITLHVKYLWFDGQWTLSYTYTSQDDHSSLLLTTCTLIHRFKQDNDPKHSLQKASQFFEESNINWWRAPAESPDCNPIEISGTRWKSTLEGGEARHAARTGWWNSAIQEDCRYFIVHSPSTYSITTYLILAYACTFLLSCTSIQVINVILHCTMFVIYFCTDTL